MDVEFRSVTPVFQSAGRVRDARIEVGEEPILLG